MKSGPDVDLLIQYTIQWAFNGNNDSEVDIVSLLIKGIDHPLITLSKV